MEVVTAITGVADVVKHVMDMLLTVRRGVLAVQEAGKNREFLPQQLCGIQDDIEELEAQYQGRGIPASPGGRVALKNLKEHVRIIKAEITELEKGEFNLEDEMKSFRERQRGKPKIKLTYKFESAVMPPYWVIQLPYVTEKLHQEVQRARDLGVFHFSTTFCESIPRLYIKPDGLCKEAVDHLKPQKDCKARCVLIWGSEGMGKRSLARVVTHDFGFNSDLSDCYPDGVFSLDCDHRGASTTESLLRGLLDKLGGNENQDSEIKFPQQQDIKQRLGNKLRGMRCFIWLYNVQAPELVSGCCPEGFEGALLVTSNKANVCQLLPKTVSVHVVNVTSDTFWKAEADGGVGFATQILAAIAANDESTRTFSSACEEVGERLVEVCKRSGVGLGDHRDCFAGQDKP
eukprot:jgi/Botrbrau1/5090/Bobra.0128s0001.1